MKWVGGREGESPRIAWWHLWKRVYLDYESQNDSRSFPDRTYNMYSNNRALLSGLENITVFYTIDGYSNSLVLDYRERIRNSVSPGVKVSFINSSTPTTIEWESPEMVSRLKNYKRLDEEISGRDTSVFNLMKGNLRDIDHNTWIKESVKYLYIGNTKRNLQLFNHYEYIIVSGVRGLAFDESLEKLEKRCANLGLKINRVTRNLGQFLGDLSPMSLRQSEKTLRSLSKTVLTDEIIARKVPFEQGMIGSSGVYMGTDIYSDLPVFKIFKKDAVNAENLLILGGTGWGKSYQTKSITLQLCANPRVRATIMDFEGDEYLPLASFFANHDEVLFLNMSEGQGSYYDPMPVLVSGNEEQDRENNVYGLAKSYTQAFINTLVGEDVLSSSLWAKTIIDDAILDTYRQAGVNPDVYDTWSRSSNLALKDVYRTIKQGHSKLIQGVSESYLAQNEDYRKSYDLIRARLSRYFEEDGIQASVFKSRVTLESIAYSKMVVCSFGMRNRSLKSVDNIQLALSQLSAACISHIRSLFCYYEGKFNLKVWEELQRWAHFPGSEEIINTAVTGGRKVGDINILVSNDPTMFIGWGAKMKIFSNLTSFLIGIITDANVREEIANILSVPELLPELNSLASFAGDLLTFNSEGGEVPDSKYYRAWLTKLDNSVVTLCKVQLPEDVSRSQLFRTASEKKEDLDD